MLTARVLKSRIVDTSFKITVSLNIVLMHSKLKLWT